MPPPSSFAVSIHYTSKGARAWSFARVRPNSLPRRDSMQLTKCAPAALRTSLSRLLPSFRRALLPAALAFTATLPTLAAPSAPLAPTPPMGWNDWAHYECGYSAQTILDNARALVRTGLAAAGYATVTIDDCWMQKDRDAQGNLQPDPRRFPQGMKSVVQAVHALGLKFGIYEDAGSATCAGFAGSGEPQGGGAAHFLQDARLFASWGVDYLKLDACNVYVPTGSTREAAYRKAYAAESAALKAVGRPIVFSESAPAYFLGTPDWYDVLTWVRAYGQLWREGTDIATYHGSEPNHPRFASVLWNYAYNLPLGRFQKPGNWNDADFIIAGDPGLTLAESRSQVALWSMMSAPLNLSSDVARLSPQALAILTNRAMLRVDQDPLGRMATLVRRGPSLDVLRKKLSGGDFAVAALNRGDTPAQVNLRPGDLGFSSGCKVDARNLWSRSRQPAASALEATVAPHDTAVWRIHPSPACGAPARSGAIIQLVAGTHRSFDGYTRCLAAPGLVEDCAATPQEVWTIGPTGELQSSGECLTETNGQPAMQKCASAGTQRWTYTLAGNLVGADQRCLTAIRSYGPAPGLSLQTCAHNAGDQIWSLPN
jgi:alpha-galactosidase